MIHPLLTKLIADLTARLAYLLKPPFKAAVNSGAALPHGLLNGLLAEGSGATGQAKPFIYGRVRRSAQRMIIEWQARRTTTTGNFAIYRSRTLTWREALPLDLSIFATVDGQSALATYRAVDTTAPLPGPYYYWIVDLTAKEGERRYGPYS